MRLASRLGVTIVNGRLSSVLANGRDGSKSPRGSSDCLERCAIASLQAVRVGEHETSTANKSAVTHIVDTDLT